MVMEMYKYEYLSSIVENWERRCLCAAGVRVRARLSCHRQLPAGLIIVLRVIKCRLVPCREAITEHILKNWNCRLDGLVLVIVHMCFNGKSTS